MKLFRRLFAKQDKHFVSDLDRFLEKFDETHPNPSQSQKKEIHKHQKLAKLRDIAKPQEKKSGIWEEF